METYRETPILVSICSITYNHAPYIRQCLDGFLMQKCDFRYEIIINDDCSTDGTTEIVKEYAEKYPDLIKPIYHEENQYKKGVRGMFATFCFPKAQGKYIALCEGDDYWTDPLKLQKQVDYMEATPNCKMTVTNARVITEKEELDWSRYKEDSYITPEEMITGGGLYVQTASIVYRNGLLNGYPECCRKCHVGDYPLQIWATLQGKVYYFSEKMVVYRYQFSGAWTSKNKLQPVDKRIKGVRSEVDMLFGLDQLTDQKYHTSFMNYARILVNGKGFESARNTRLFYNEFKEIINTMPIRHRLSYFFIRNNMKFIYNILKSTSLISRKIIRIK